jgi:hypothetical protein
MVGWWKKLVGQPVPSATAEMDDLRARVDAFKAQGGPEIEAHPHCTNNRPELDASDVAGCFYCLEVFEPETVVEWVDSDDTAICPKCGIDSVIGSASGYPVSDRQFLTRMHEKWF